MARAETASTKAAPSAKRACRKIETEADIAAGLRFLRRRCRHLRAVHDASGDPPLRRRPPGFEGLARIIVGQQLSIASADAIWSRALALVRPFEAQCLIETTDEALRGAGLSRPKIKTLRATAEALCSGELDLAGIGERPDEQVRAALTQVSGVGPWTADIYLMFCLGRADGWAPGDLALQISVHHALALDDRPKADDMLEIGERWRPWRGVAARLLWSYYRLLKQRKSGQPV